MSHDFRWHVLSVVPHSTARVCERAAELGATTYCPMLRTIDGSRNGRKAPTEVSKPLFGGYVFVSLPTDKPRFDIFHRAFANSSQHDGGGIDGCLGLLGASEGPAAVSDAVIQDLRDREARGEFDLTGCSDDGKFIVPKWCRRREAVVFTKGPFATYWGTVAKVKNSAIARVSMIILGQEHEIDAPIAWLAWRGRGV
jgi:transcription antitermination factor NusG